MKARIVLVVVVLIGIIFCSAQSALKKTQINENVTVQWPSEDTVIIITTVSQQVSTKQLLKEKQQLLSQINQYQLKISELQERVAYIDSISASYTDPNEP